MTMSKALYLQRTGCFHNYCIKYVIEILGKQKIPDPPQTISGYVQFLPSSALLENSSGKPFPPTLEDIMPLRNSVVRTNSGGERSKPVFEPLSLKSGLLNTPTTLHLKV